MYVRVTEFESTVTVAVASVSTPSPPPCAVAEAFPLTAVCERAVRSAPAVSVPAMSAVVV